MKMDTEELVTDEEYRRSLARLALSMYIGEKCKYCGKEAKTLEDLYTVVFAGYHEHGRIACQRCWDEHHKGDKNGQMEEI
jgi:hypothetical protein